MKLLTVFLAVTYYSITAAPVNDYHISGTTGIDYRQLKLFAIGTQRSGSNVADSKIYILYPRAKADKTFYVFFNKKNVSRISYGERQEYECNGNIDLLTVIQEAEQYVEPRTAAKNTRNLFLKEGKTYYLQINGKGQLEYIADENDGAKLLNDNGKYVSPLKKSQFKE